MKIKLLLLSIISLVIMKNINAQDFEIPEGTKTFYETGIEKIRLDRKMNRLEKKRVENILDTFLPKAPATILDIGGGMGIYSFYLAQKGYSVYLIDPVAFNIEEAKKTGENQKDFPLAGFQVGDARKIEMPDNSADVVLFFGPLYHLDEKSRQIALLEAYRVLKPNGMIFAQGVSKFCTLFNGYFDGKIKDQRMVQEVKNTLKTNDFEYKSGLFFTHTALELKNEIEEAGFSQVETLAIEGLGKWIDDEYWEDEKLREELLEFLEITQKESSIIGVSSHIMAIGQKNKG